MAAKKLLQDTWLPIRLGARYDERISAVIRAAPHSGRSVLDCTTNLEVQRENTFFLNCMLAVRFAHRDVRRARNGKPSLYCFSSGVGSGPFMPEGSKGRKSG